jgi:hypothetical protein
VALGGANVTNTLDGAGRPRNGALVGAAVGEVAVLGVGVAPVVVVGAVVGSPPPDPVVVPLPVVLPPLFEVVVAVPETLLDGDGVDEGVSDPLPELELQAVTRANAAIAAKDFAFMCPLDLDCPGSFKLDRSSCREPSIRKTRIRT